MKDAAIGMLNDRMAELAQKPDCPFLQASSSYGKYLFSKTKDAFSVDALPKEGQTEAAMKAAFIEARRAAEFGFTATEYKRYQQNFLSQLDKQFSNKDKRYNNQFCRQYVNHYLENEPIPSLDDYYQVMKQIVPMMPVEAINQLMQQLVTATDSNMVTINAVSADTTMGTVTGGGVYEVGATVTLTATPKEGYHFVRWSTGDTTRVLTFIATEDLNIVAQFEANTGIDEIEGSNATIYSAESNIYVKGAENMNIYVYDVNGRCVRTQANATETVVFKMNTTGVYLVKVGNAPAKRVVVVR
jgi:major membrane immunogen (membrane-anchored lipoprotein)